MELKKLGKKDEFLKLDGLINDPDVNKAIEENCLNGDENENIYIERKFTEYHKLKVSDLPLYKVYEGYKCKWYYRLDVIDGKQRCLKIKDDEINGMELLQLNAECILDAENKDCEEQEWMLACAKVLNYMTPDIKK